MWPFFYLQNGDLSKIRPINYDFTKQGLELVASLCFGTSSFSNLHNSM